MVQSTGRQERAQTMLRRIGLLIVLVAALGAVPAAAQRTHSVKLVRSADGERYRFDPVRVTARAGEVVEFSVQSGGPYVIAFEPADVSPGQRPLLATALGSNGSGLRSPVLRAGERFRLVIPALARGTYRFASALHIAYRMTGELVVP